MKWQRYYIGQQTPPMKLIVRNTKMQPLLMFLLILLCAGTPVLAQEAEASNIDPCRAAERSEYVRIKGHDVSSLLANLGYKYDIPIGVEVAMNTQGWSELRMNVKRKTPIEDVLRQFEQEHKEYSWELKDGIVNVFPKEGYRDPILQQLLNVEIEELSLRKGAVTWEVETALLATPKLKALATTYGLGTLGFVFSGFYFPNLGRNYKLDVSEMTVSAILNKIIRESPTARFWSITRGSSENTLSIAFVASHEDTPKHLKTCDFDDLLPDSP